MNAPNAEYLSQEKFGELKRELEELKTIGRKQIAEQLEYAKSLGDLSENAEYHEAREVQAGIEDRIARLEDVLRRAVIMETRHSSTAGLGSTVVVTKSDGGEQTLTIVGSEEVNTVQGKISNESPLGAALMGKKKGDAVTITTPKGPVTYTITTVS